MGGRSDSFEMIFLRFINISNVIAGTAVGDPIGGCHVTPYGYSVMLKVFMGFARGKIALALEGGYNLDSIANSVLACMEV
ncbi:hypothetical protein Pint_16244 [Pistacia integerrima]|uniref:Uncharacterized protein n=1 Tax=Pistacia integerrima TaxID=434235 RepID=A0ACC0Z8P4_9ROSI|nr:hypothetical protein Pint_16244 [Pistacia integerrima]